MEGFHAAGLEHTTEDIVHDEGAEVADVGRSIDGGATTIEAEGFAVDRLEFALGASECIEEVHWEVGKWGADHDRDGHATLAMGQE